MRKYNHLTWNDRIIIERMCKAKNQQKDIALVLGKSPATISNELKRNTFDGHYRADKAHVRYYLRLHMRPKRSIFTDKIISEIKILLKKKFSPETIANTIKSCKISHQSIYNFIERDKETGGKLYELLFFQKRRRKKYGSNENRGQIKNRKSIDLRPKVVDNKARYGDWEGDLIVGKNHKGAMLVLVERKTKSVKIRKLSGKNAKEVSTKIISSLRYLKAKTLTLDNGKEFAYHDKISKSLNIEVYFAHPYSSWERGLSENSNRLVRQYFPKDKDLRNVSRASIKKCERELNARPRKSLNWQSPDDFINKLKIA